MRHLPKIMLAGSLIAATYTFAAYAETAAIQPSVTQLKLGHQLQRRMLQAPSKSQDILVYMRDQANLSAAKSMTSKQARGRFVAQALQATAARSQAALRAMLDQRGIKYTSYYLGNLLVVQNADQNLIDELAARDDVSRILGNPKFKAVEPANRAQLTADQDELGSIKLRTVGDNIRRTGAETLWAQGFKGQGIVVAGQDTGIEWNHPALIGHYRGTTSFDAVTGAIAVDHNYSWHDAIHAPLNPTAAANPCGYNTAAPCDDHGHGTHTMGTMVGDDGRGNQVGMAPEAKWIGCRNMDAGVGQPSTYLECFQYFLAPWPMGGDAARDANPDMAPHVMNNSWGCTTDEGCEGDEFVEVLQALKDAGIMVVAAAGNDGPSCRTIKDGPATSSDSVFVVGAFDHRSGTIASFSSRGPSTLDSMVGPDLSAPGVSIRSAIPGGTYSSASWSGTSMAAPHAVGAIALLWSAKPELIGQVATTTALFTASAEPKTTTQTCGGVAGTQIPNNTYGSGLLNVTQALQRANQ